MMNAEKQIRSFENRCKGLKKKLWELSTLCDVEVCMVCTRPSSSQLHVWPEDRSRVEQIITNYRMMMKSGCGKNKKKVVHSVLDINGGGRKKEVPAVSEEQHLNFLGKDQGKTKEEIFLESLPHEKLKEFLSALSGKIEKVKQEIALKKMQAELMELMYGDATISPMPMGENENENLEAASCSSTSSSCDNPAVLEEQHLNFLGKDQGKTKEEIILESLPCEKLKEFLSALNGKIEKVKQEIALKKMQAELMELMYGDATISPRPMSENENENVEAASCSSTYSSYDDHQKMTGPVSPVQQMPQNHLTAAVPGMQGMIWMPTPQNHMRAVPLMQEMVYRIPQSAPESYDGRNRLC